MTREEITKAIEVDSYKFIDRNGKVMYIVPQEVIDYMAEIEYMIHCCKMLKIYRDADEELKGAHYSVKGIINYISQLEDIAREPLQNLRKKFPAWDSREKRPR